MERSVRCLLIMAVAIGAVGAASASEPAATNDAIGGDSCCFTNPQFAGVCKVTLSGDETCEDVLAYLNNPSSVGKTYCGKTKVRGGWLQVECEDSGDTTATACGDVPHS